MLRIFKSRILQLPLFWRLNIAGWTLFFIPASVLALVTQRSLERGLGLPLFQIPMEILITWGFRHIYRSRIQRFDERAGAWMIVITLLGAALQVALVHVIIHFTQWHNPYWTELEEWLLRLIFAWLAFMAWSLLYFGIKSEMTARTESKRADAAVAEANRTELQLLRAQLDPHFIFNALNGIAAEIAPHPKAALEMVRQLAAYLRYTLDRRHDQVIALGLELDAMRAYLKIEEARFGELMLKIEADPSARGRLIPSFLVQPLVENAVKHGRQNTSTAWQLQILARASENGLSIETRHLGKLHADWRTEEGVGLSVLRRRLDLHYPDRHQFTLEESEGWVTAKLELTGDPCCA